MINKNEKLKVAIIGLGYVGLPLALEFAKKRPIIAFDIEEKRIKELKSGIDKNLESTKEELQESEQINFTSHKEDLVLANCFIVTVPTPIDKYKKPDLRPLLKASDIINKVISIFFIF